MKTVTCKGSATSAKTGLPAGFPQPDAVTYVASTASGPTNIVDGYKTGGKNSTEGIVALRGGSSCSNGNVSVHITNRPSG